MNRSLLFAARLVVAHAHVAYAQSRNGLGPVLTDVMGGHAIEKLFCSFAVHPYGDAIEAVDGRMNVPCGIGLGVEPDPDWLDAFGGPVWSNP